MRLYSVLKDTSQVIRNKKEVSDILQFVEELGLPVTPLLARERAIKRFVNNPSQKHKEPAIKSIAVGLKTHGKQYEVIRKLVKPEPLKRDVMQSICNTICLGFSKEGLDRSFAGVTKTALKGRGSWSADDERLLLWGLSQFGWGNWTEIQQVVGDTKTYGQVRTKCHRYFGFH
jgi:hypothetical protein